LQGVYAEGARWYSGEHGGGQLQDHCGRCLQVVENLQVDFFNIYFFLNLKFTESKTKECANFKFKVRSSVK